MPARPRAARLSAALIIAFTSAARAQPPAPDSPPPLWLVVGPPPHLEALAPLAAARGAEGFEVRMSTAPPSQAIGACPRPPSYLLLAGAVARAGQRGPQQVPTRWGTLYRWRSTQAERYAADPLFADLDGDGAPEFPVGRIPARDPGQMREVVEKILARERRALSPADLGLPLWGGTTGVGDLADEVATLAFQRIVRTRAPAWSEPWILWGYTRSSLCPPAGEQAGLFGGRLADGGLVSAMIGHGSPTSFLSSGGLLGTRYRPADAAALGGAMPGPPHFILACDCGSHALGHERHCLAEALLFAPGGPVAVVAATTESHPLTNYYSALEVLRQLGRPHSRLGDLWHDAQRDAFRRVDHAAETILKNAEGALEAEIDIPQLKRDHLLMYTLFGDPATKLPRILPLPLRRDGARISIDPPAGATRLWVSICRPAPPLPHAHRHGAPPEERLALFERRNAAKRFQPLAEIAAGRPWTFQTNEPGQLRLVVAADDHTLYVATVASAAPPEAKSSPTLEGLE